MTEIAGLERRYRHWPRWHPRSCGDEHEEEMLGVLRHNLVEIGSNRVLPRWRSPATPGAPSFV